MYRSKKTIIAIRNISRSSILTRFNNYASTQSPSARRIMANNVAERTPRRWLASTSVDGRTLLSRDVSIENNTADTTETLGGGVFDSWTQRFDALRQRVYVGAKRTRGGPLVDSKVAEAAKKSAQARTGKDSKQSSEPDAASSDTSSQQQRPASPPPPPPRPPAGFDSSGSSHDTPPGGPPNPPPPSPVQVAALVFLLFLTYLSLRSQARREKKRNEHSGSGDGASDTMSSGHFDSSSSSSAPLGPGKTRIFEGRGFNVIRVDPISPQQFLTEVLPTLDPGAKIIVYDNGASVRVLNGQAEVCHFEIGSPQVFEEHLEEMLDVLEMPIESRPRVIYRRDNARAFRDALLTLAPTVLFIAAILWSSRKAIQQMGAGGQGGPMSFGKSRAKQFKKETNVGVTFKDVAGLPEAKQEIKEFVDFLKDASRFKRLGAKIPRGALLVGPPGNGKTLLAKAAAGEANVPFFVTSGSEFIEMFVGVGPARVRDLFKQARENAPSIVFIDEIDAVGRSRANSSGGGGHDERESTLNALLVEMDGFNDSEEVVVMAGTNRADMLDKALTRPGRFDRQISIDNPDLKSREEIFGVHLRPLLLVNRDEFAKAAYARYAKLDPEHIDSGVKKGHDGAKTTKAEAEVDALIEEVFEYHGETQVLKSKSGKEVVLNTTEESLKPYGLALHDRIAWPPHGVGTVFGVSVRPRPLVWVQFDKLAKEGKSGFKCIDPAKVGVDALLKAATDSLLKGDEVEADIVVEKERLLHEYAKKLAKMTPGFSGADVANVCNEGALIAAREGAECVEFRHLEAAIDRVIGGLEKKSKVMTREERETVAWHEAGHAVSSWFLEHCDPTLKVSIVPRGIKPTGYAQYDSSDRFLFNKEEMLDRMCHQLSGRAAEVLRFNTLTTAAKDDLERVTKWAYYQMSVYGMNEKVGALSYQSGGGAWGSDGFSGDYGEEMAQLMDEEVRKLVASAFERTKNLLREHWAGVESVANLLLKQETVHKADLVELLGERPFSAPERDEGALKRSASSAVNGAKTQSDDVDAGDGGDDGADAPAAAAGAVRVER